MIVPMENVYTQRAPLHWIAVVWFSHVHTANVLSAKFTDECL